MPKDNSLIAQLMDGSYSNELVTKALSIHKSSRSSWEQLFQAAVYLNKISINEGHYDAYVMEMLDTALQSGLTYTRNKEYFLEALRISARLCLKYNQLKQANNHLLLLRELDGELPTWANNVSAKLFFKLEFLTAIKYPEEFFHLLNGNQNHSIDIHDPQKLGVVKEFINTIPQYLEQNIEKLSLLPGFILKLEDLLNEYADEVAEDWEQFLKSVLQLFRKHQQNNSKLEDSVVTLIVQNNILTKLLESTTRRISLVEDNLETYKELIDLYDRKITSLSNQVNIPSMDTTSVDSQKTNASIQTSPPVLRRNRKILVLGTSQIPAAKIYGIAKVFGLDKSEIDLRLDYQTNKRFDIEQLRFNSPYSGILVGPIAHKVVGLGDYTSVVQKLKNEDGYPPIEEIRTSSGELKISKTALKDAFRRLNAVIQANDVA